MLTVGGSSRTRQWLRLPLPYALVPSILYQACVYQLRMKRPLHICKLQQRASDLARSTMASSDACVTTSKPHETLCNHPSSALPTPKLLSMPRPTHPRRCREPRCTRTLHPSFPSSSPTSSSPPSSPTTVIPTAPNKLAGL